MSTLSPLQYHPGQLEVQAEANSRHVAEKLAHWVGPVERYATAADLVLLALRQPDGNLGFAALSGPPPLAGSVGPLRLGLRPELAELLDLDGPIPVGGLVISLARAERARINGMLRPVPCGLELEAQELFTLCRKYMAPSVGLDEAVTAGPRAREPIGTDDPWVVALVARAETSFLASISPQGGPDVAHRGGPAGFLHLDAAAGTLEWTELVGDGVFKSAGNVRATGTATLLVPDFDTGDALELVGRAGYETLRFERRPRQDPLLRFRDPYPVQGRMTLRLEAARRLRGLCWPRQPLREERVTSCSTVDDQAPL